MLRDAALWGRRGETRNSFAHKNEAVMTDDPPYRPESAG